MKGIQLMTDRDHSLSEFEIFPAEKMARADRLLIGDKPRTGFLGFGAALTPSSCYNLNLMEKGEREKLLKHLYSPEGLNLSVARLCIGSSDYSPELYSYDDTPFDTELRDFSVKRDEAYIIPMIREVLKIRPDLYLFASPWSPPGWMKTGGNLCGGYMREKYLDCYADYTVKFLQAYATYGIRISAITPQNEPNTHQKGLMPACIWHPETEAKYVKLLRKKLDAAGLDVKIFLYDHGFSDAGRVLWALENIKGLSRACDGVAFHYYAGTIEETLPIRKKFPELPLHFTEGGPRLYDHYDSDWCKWAIMISKAITCGYSSFTGWNLLLDERGGPNIGPFFCGGLLTRNSESGALSESGQYRALSHIAKYITPQSKLYPVAVGEEYAQQMSSYPKDKKEIYGFAIENEGTEFVLIAVNPNADKSQVQFSVHGQSYYAELMPESVSTMIIKGEKRC